MSYQVGVDLGSTLSALAVCRSGGNPAPEIVPMSSRTVFVPTVVYASRDGSVLVGDEADHRALTDPDRVARQFIRRIGDGVPLLAGGTAMPAEVLAARFITRMVDVAAARLAGPATRVAVAHPVGWGAHRVAALRDALAGHGLFVPAPQAAVLAQSMREVIEPGATVAVYDLGGATFSASVIRRVTTEQFTVVGRAEELELGGADFDEVVFAHVTAELGAAWEALDPADPAVRSAVAALRRECTAAKEALSANTDVLIPVALPGITTSVRLGRAEFEEAIQPGIEETVAALHRTLDSAGVGAAELAAVLLIGGSARVPLVTQAVSEQLGRPVTLAGDPKGIVAIGAALAARGLLDPPPTRAFPVPEPRVPVLAGEPQPVLAGQPYQPVGVRPPLPIGPPRARDDRRWLGMPRTVITAVAAVVLAVALTGGVAFLANRTKPADSDADPGSVRKQGTSQVTETPPADEPTIREKPPVTTTVPPKTTRKTEAPRPTTTRTRPPTTTTTTWPPSSTTTTTTTSKAGA
jgi:actin-like ATPase involved in cell morphogenesis